MLLYLMTLEQAQTLIGMPVNAPMVGVFKVEKIAQLKSGKILAYNKYNWCCDVNILRDSKRERFKFEKKLDDK